MPRIVITGDRPLIRTALGLLISSSGTFSVAGECSNDADALAAAVSDRPDVVVMELDLDSSCVAAPHWFAQLVRAAHGCPVLIVTSREDAQAAALALRHGVAGIVLNTRPADVLLRAIQAVANGQTWLERSMVASVFQPAASHRDVECAVPTVREKLTRRETQVVELIRLGLPNKKIGERLFISETTVRHHLTSIYDKLAVTNRMELMRYTYSEGAVA